ncbi:MAG: zf-HC2 domain-containing protein [Candidatus Atribacteria bacterium]|nr:zf-HC2 domain-containing protein [Candidatus Atribacteria bacterium]MCD6350414.1 zf-HC2 domain-containing protein [Candidatus Atribacteria bacterium]
MNCREAVEKLYLYLDGEILTEEERKSLEEHLNLCRACYKRYEFEKFLWDLVRQNGQRESVPQTLIMRIENVLARF